MLYETLSQPFIFLLFTLSGFVSAFLFDLKNILKFLFKKNKIINQILLFLTLSITLFICYFINLKYNYGQFRIFSVLGFILAFCLQRFISTNFVAKPFLKCYNKIKEKQNERKVKKI